MAHGLRLYSGVWENKPPGLYGLYLAVYHSLGPSLIAVRILALGTALATTILTYFLARGWVSEQAALVAALLAGLLFDVPFLEGTTANAEIFVALFAALGMYFGIRRQPELAAVAMVCAVSFKAVAIFDASALGIWYLSRERDVFARYAAMVVAAMGAGALCLWLTGMLGGFMRDAVLYNLGYVGHANGGVVPWLAIVKVLVLVVGTVWLWKAPLPGLWLLWAVAGSFASGRVFGHYFLEAVVPFALVVGIVAERGWKWSPPRPGWERGLGGEGTRRALLMLPVAYLCLAMLSALAGWGLATSGHDSIFARRLQYYANAVRYGLGTETAAMYRSQIDDHVNRNIAVAHVVRGLPSGRMLVWGNTPWVYVLSMRLPATSYTSALRSPEVPGETATLRRAIRSGRPRVVVIVKPAAPPLGSARIGLERRYRVAGQVGNALVYVRRSSA